MPGEIVGSIFPGEVTLKIASAESGSLAPFQAAPPETTFRPEKPPLTPASLGGSAVSAESRRRLISSRARPATRS